MDYLTIPSKASVIKNEVEDVLPNSGEFFDAPNLVSSLKREDIALGNCSGFLEPYKLEPDTQEMGSYKKGVEGTSSIDIKTPMETSDCTPSFEDGNPSVNLSPRNSTLASESGPEDWDCSGEGLIRSTVHCSDGVTLPQLSGPTPIIRVRKLTKRDIEELTAGIWRCVSCGKAETSFLMLDLHIDTGCEELSPIECDVCPSVVHDYRDFVVHIMEHRMGERRKCAICLREFIGDMREHLFLQGHFSPDVSELGLQGNVSLGAVQNPSTSVFFNLNESETEAKYLNSEETCLNSRLFRKKQSKLKQHKRIHKCGVCQKSFSQLAILNAHQRVHTGERPYKCDKCHETFSQLGSLDRHQKAHTGERPYKCNLCQKSFSESCNLKTHQRVHTGERPYKCDKCHKTFSQLASLNRHQKAHTDERPYNCNLCQKSFFESYNLKTHQRVHTGERPYNCNLCQKSFSESYNLKAHQRVHTGERPYKCVICPKSFSGSGSLKTHQRVHTGERPYKCNVCQKSFSESCSLKTHQRIHTGERPYQCVICLKSFSKSSSLKRHKRVHTGERPYKCDKCQKSFSDQSYFRRHQRVLHI